MDKMTVQCWAALIHLSEWLQICPETESGRGGGRGAAKHRASTDNLCLTSSPGQPGNFHIRPGLLSLPISGVLHNTQQNNSPSFLNCLLSIKLAKYLKR